MVFVIFSKTVPSNFINITFTFISKLVEFFCTHFSDNSYVPSTDQCLLIVDFILEKKTI